MLDGGLRAAYKDFCSLRVRAFPGASAADEIWATAENTATVPLAPAYRALLNAGKVPCSVTTLAKRAVGAPFVGCYAAAVLLAELLRREPARQATASWTSACAILYSRTRTKSELGRCELLEASTLIPRALLPAN